MKSNSKHWQNALVIGAIMVVVSAVISAGAAYVSVSTPENRAYTETNLIMMKKLLETGSYDSTAPLENSPYSSADDMYASDEQATSSRNSLIFDVISFAAILGLIIYGYIRFKKTLHIRKSEWLMTMTTTTALLVAYLLDAIISGVTIGGEWTTQVLQLAIHPVALILTVLSSFLTSLVIVMVIAYIYKKRTGFEVG